MFDRERIISIGSPTALSVVLVVMAAAAALGLLINRLSLDTRFVVAFFLGIGASVILVMPTDRVMRFGFTLFIISFGFGWRTIHVSSGLEVHPSEVLAWLLFLALLIRGLASHSTIRFNIPFLALAFLGLSLTGILPAVLRRQAPETILEELKVYLVLMPTFYVVQWMIKDREDWTQATRWSVLVGAYIGLLGVIDYFVPSLTLAISGNTRQVTTVLGSDDTFQRVGFLFYGSYVGAFVIFMFFAFGLGWLAEAWEARERRTLALSALAVGVMALGMYLSGYRGLWYAVLGFGVLLIILFRRARLLLLLPLAGLPLLPTTFYLRFESIYLQQYADSSFFKRLARAQYALNQIQNYPLSGTGFGGPGYVHSDLLQIGATFGLPTLFVFVLMMATSIWRLFLLVSRRDWIGRYAGLLFAYLCAQMVIFAGEGLIVWVQVMIPFWFVWALAIKLIEFAKAEPAAAMPPASAQQRPAPVPGSESRP